MIANLVVASILLAVVACLSVQCSNAVYMHIHEKKNKRTRRPCPAKPVHSCSKKPVEIPPCARDTADSCSEDQLEIPPCESESHTRTGVQLETPPCAEDRSRRQLENPPCAPKFTIDRRAAKQAKIPSCPCTPKLTDEYTNEQIEPPPCGLKPKSDGYTEEKVETAPCGPKPNVSSPTEREPATCTEKQSENAYKVENSAKEQPQSQLRPPKFRIDSCTPHPSAPKSMVEPCAPKLDACTKEAPKTLPCVVKPQKVTKPSYTFRDLEQTGSPKVSLSISPKCKPKKEKVEDIIVPDPQNTPRCAPTKGAHHGSSKLRGCCSSSVPGSCSPSEEGLAEPPVVCTHECLDVCSYTVITSSLGKKTRRQRC